MKVYIPSKARADRCRTLDLMINNTDCLKYVWLVVEPQDVDSYVAKYPIMKDNILVLPESNQGISYVRNYIMNYAKDEDLYWMVDDDIKKFGQFDYDNPKIEHRFDLLDTLKEKTEFILTNPACFNVRQAGFEYRPLAYWASVNKKPLKFNTYCDVCVAVVRPNELLDKNVHYRKLKLKEDRDFTMQILALGFETLRFNTIWFDVPRNGKEPGGLKFVYDQLGIEERESERMVEIWGDDICKVIKKYKRDAFAVTRKKPLSEEELERRRNTPIRVDVKINWTKLANKYSLDPLTKIENLSYED